jgi:hypothetical protein
MSERDQGDESPVWVKAAGEGQQRAAYLTRFYLDRDSIEIHELAALCEARQWEVRAARYVALHGGLLERVGAGKFRATAKGRRLVERGIDGHGV